MKRKNVVKKEVYFIATKYKNKPVQVSFYVKGGKQVPEDKVEKQHTGNGVRLYAFNV